MVKIDVTPFPLKSTWFPPPPPQPNPSPLCGDYPSPETIRSWYMNQFTWANATCLHFVPVVNMLKLASPWCTPDWEPWNANQSMVVELLSMPRPPFTRQALKSFVVTSSTQINAGSWTTWDSFPWLIETNRRTGDPSEKLLLNETRLHWKSLFPTRFMPILPLSTPVIKTTNKRKYAHFIYS